MAMLWPTGPMVINSFFSSEHSFGHSYAMVAALNDGHFDENICLSSRFMLLEFICGQGIIVTVTAFSGELYYDVNSIRLIFNFSFNLEHIKSE